MKFNIIDLFKFIGNFLLAKQKNTIFIPTNYIVKIKHLFLSSALILLLVFSSACGGIGGSDSDNPAEIDLPGNPIERAAYNGLITSYRESTMWQIQNVETLNITPMAPSGELLELQDPKEVYCVCLQYDAKYKVTWSTDQGSPWEKTVRNILVIKTQGDQFIPVEPMNVCSPFC